MRKAGAVGAFLRKYGSRCGRCGAALQARTGCAIPQWNRDSVSPHLGVPPCFRGGHRMDQLLFPLPLPAPREGNPGPACLRGVCRRHFLWASAKGRGRSPSSLCRFKGVWGKQAKRRQWRMKRACFEEAARLAAPKRGRESQCRDGVEIEIPAGG